MSSEDTELPEEGSAPVPAAIAATAEPVQLEVRLIQDDRVPAEMVCMGTYRNGRLVARSVMAPETWDHIEQERYFDEPLQVVLVAREAPPGLQCQLFAMIPISEGEEGEETNEPWAASVPSSSYEATLASDSAEEEEVPVAPVPLGNIVRYQRDRVHPDSLPLETADVLKKIIEGDASEVIDRALADLLGLDGGEGEK
jgi:hypothetical protein